MFLNMDHWYTLRSLTKLMCIQICYNFYQEGAVFLWWSVLIFFLHNYVPKNTSASTIYHLGVCGVKELFSLENLSLIRFFLKKRPISFLWWSALIFFCITMSPRIPQHQPFIISDLGVRGVKELFPWRTSGSIFSQKASIFLVRTILNVGGGLQKKYWRSTKLSIRDITLRPWMTDARKINSFDFP